MHALAEFGDALKAGATHGREGKVILESW